MAKFEEEKVINVLHPEKAQVGKKYWFSDSINILKRHVEDNNTEGVGELKSIDDTKDVCLFHIEGRYDWELLYPYEEPPKQRMTNIQLMEWLTKGYGLYSRKGTTIAFCKISCSIDELNDKVDEDIIIRTWDNEEWIEPTVDIYERDCKGDKKQWQK